MQRRRSVLERASPLILESSSSSVAFGELPSSVVGQATQLLARGGAQFKVKSAMCGGVCPACAGMCQHVASGETNGSAFIQPLQVPMSPNCHQCINVRPVMPLRLQCPSCCIQYVREDNRGYPVSGSMWNYGMSSCKSCGKCMESRTKWSIIACTICPIDY